MDDDQRNTMMNGFGEFIADVFHSDRRDIRIACCRAWSEYANDPEIGERLACYAEENFGRFPELAMSLRAWPDEQLRFLAGTLLQVIRCPRIPPPPPVPPDPPGPPPDPFREVLPPQNIFPVFRAVYGEEHGITISMRGDENQMVITFERPDFQRPRGDPTR